MLQCGECGRWNIVQLDEGKVTRHRTPDGGERFCWSAYWICVGCGAHWCNETELEAFPPEEVKNVEHL